MKPQPLKPELTVAGLLCGVAVGLFFAPPGVTGPVRSAVRDAVVPGQYAVGWMAGVVDEAVSGFRRSAAYKREVAALESDLAAWKLRCRRLQLEAALAHEKLAEAEQSRHVGFGADVWAEAHTTGPLIVPELVDAAVLGEENAVLWRSGRLIDRGSTAGVVESALVLEGEGPLIDRGEDFGLATGHPVYSGRCVVGRIETVGRWSSTIRRVTDPDYRGLAQIVRHTSGGSRFGPQGILEGRGEPLCRLKFVAAAEPVGEGDEVYTADRDGLLPYPMYYGQVVKAELRPGEPHWDVWVKPAATEFKLRTVQILRKSVNPVRLVGE